MRKQFLILVVLCFSILVGCQNDKAIKIEDDQEIIKVYTSNYPLYEFAKNIGGDKVKVVNITGQGGFHGWEPSARDIANLQEADLFIYNGPEIDKWAQDLIDDQIIEVEILDASQGLDLLESSHNHEEEHEEEEHVHETYDPHIWLSLKNADIISKNISDYFKEIDINNTDIYEENYKNYSKQLISLDKEYKEKLSNKKRDTIIVSHEAYGYLCRDYGFKQVGIEGINAEGEPSVGQIDNIIKTSKDLNSKIIFYEESISPKVVEMIANEVGAELVLLSPLELLTGDQEAAGEDYLSIMKSNLQGINKALNE